MLYQSHNPYSVLSETISFDNVQKMGKLITLKTLCGSCSYSKYASVLYRNYVNDLNRKSQANYVLSDAYDLAQFARLTEPNFRIALAISLFTRLRPNELSTAKIEGNFIVAINSKRKNGKVEYKKNSYH